VEARLMARPATSRLKVNPPLGRMPVLQFLAPAELGIDPSYQRSLEAGSSKSLIRRIAQHWNWDLCLPLVVSRRAGGVLLVIDGQHRLEAARLRGDIAHLPCVVGEYASAADEAASFVHLNQQRRPLTKLDLFKAAVASEDPEAAAILAAMTAAGLSIAPHQNYISWKPGMVSNIGGIEAAWRAHGERVTTIALDVLAKAFAGQVLRYAGTIFPGIAAVCRDEIDKRADAGRLQHFIAMVGNRSQNDWRRDVMRARSDDPNLKFAKASAEVLREHWARKFGFFSEEPAKLATTPVLTQVRADAFAVAPTDDPGSERRAWCEQCERRVTIDKAAACLSQFCKMKQAQAA
jgi:hypothetical protein